MVGIGIRCIGWRHPFKELGCSKSLSEYGYAVPARALLHPSVPSRKVALASVHQSTRSRGFTKLLDLPGP